MMRRIILILFTIISFNVLLYGQKDYFGTATSISVGVKLIDGGNLNYKEINEKTGEKTIRYTPDVVKEYGFGNGRVFVSRKISIGDTLKYVFLERLKKGKFNFYLYKGEGVNRFFLQKDSLSWVEIANNYNSKENNTFRDVLKENTGDCENIGESIKLVSLNKSSLLRFLSFYNRCKNKPFPFFKYGILLGYENTSIVSNPNVGNVMLKDAVFKNDHDFLIGLFLDVPIFQTYFSFHPELFYQKNAFSSHIESGTAVSDYVINSQSLNIPLLVRYTLPLKGIRPYIEAGPSFIYHFKNDNRVYSVPVNNNVIELDKETAENLTIVSPMQLGYSIGGGIQLKMNYRNSIFIGIRSNSYKMVSETLGTTKIQFLTGLNF